MSSKTSDSACSSAMRSEMARAWRWRFKRSAFSIESRTAGVRSSRRSGQNLISLRYMSVLPRIPQAVAVSGRSTSRPVSSKPAALISAKAASLATSSTSASQTP